MWNEPVAAVVSAWPAGLVEWHPWTAGVVAAAVLTVALLALSGFASGSEIAFFSLTPQDLEALQPDRTAADKAIVELRRDSERTLATILILNNLVNVTVIMLCNYIFASLVTFRAAWLEFAVMTVLLTFLLLLFGEIMPKVYSRDNPLKFCRRAASGIRFFRTLFWPLETVLMKSGTWAGRAVPREKRQLSMDDLEQALELTNKDEIKDEQSMLRGIIRFGGETAREVMTSRQDIVGLEMHCDFAAVLRCVVENNYSRIPVYQGDGDHIRGVLYIKDLLPYLSKPAAFRWQSLVRPAYFVPETKKIDDLLREFQENKIHIAIVVDEYGGTSGLVTLEDILEEIVGEINDEYDGDEKTYVRLGADSWLFEGKTLLSDFCRIVQCADEPQIYAAAGEADTLAGLLLELKGDFPALHERLSCGGYAFEVAAVEERRISRVKVTAERKEEAGAGAH